MIISHRGYWKINSEKNTVKAFERSFSLGFGTETDIRDYKGELVISHDMPNPNTNHLSVKDFFSIYNSYNKTLLLALNIKADGLQEPLNDIIKEYDIRNYFVFDMSVPDAIGYHKYNINTFTRESEYENPPSFYEQAKGVWMDEFQDSWIETSLIQRHVDSNKQVCIVSPELHGRTYEDKWEKYRGRVNFNSNKHIHLCTDVPELAKEYFNE
ncbi:hypothetical protein [Lentiprolixibacter aurantiacus]|uniref:Phosphodiesterase n=1 Tax=Lentiprolixibacter aurantiacus TaxID=2993939 RepID=A0AAE3MKG1_9FLAO|nr:hypothetical protein [Lentiprolixibacter aurantiacus]MCX2718539.1 hypothetical protein [Lentiprolixibacter aurantiacus]